MATYSEFVYSDYFKTELPSHWQEKRLGFLAEQTKNAFVDGPFGSDLKSDDYLDEGVPLIQLNNIRDGKHILRNMKFISDHKKLDLIRHLALPKDIVIAKMAEPVARATIVSDEYDEYIIVADCVKLTPNLNLVDLDFLVWAINSDCVRENAELVSTGTTRIRINLGELKKLKVPYPSLTEQIKIREYLDHETAQIDTLIAKQEKLIELLKEKRQAVISHAVTKGLNPDVRMKDSGVEWLGQMPEHWEGKPLKYLCTYNNDTLSETTPKETEIQYIDIGSVSAVNGISKIETMIFKDAPSRARRIVRDGDVIVSTVRTYLEAIASIDSPPENLVVSTGFIVIRPNQYLYKGFASYCLRAKGFIKEVIARSVGVSYPAINSSDLVNISIPSLEYCEQMKITNFLDSQTAKIDELIRKAESAIQLMQERRTALISSAVTGKIDVRNWQNPNKNYDAKTELGA